MSESSLIRLVDCTHIRSDTHMTMGSVSPEILLFLELLGVSVRERVPLISSRDKTGLEGCDVGVEGKEMVGLDE